MAISHDNLFRALGIGLTNRYHLIDNAEQGVERRLDRIATIDGHVAVQNLLKYFCVRNQAVAIADQFFEEPLGVTFMRMRCSHKIHGNI